MHALGSEREQALPRRGRVPQQRINVHALARRSERSEPRETLLQQNAGAVEVAASPVMEPDPDLQDAVIEVADRRLGRAPEELQRLVLVEELARVELFDGPQKLGRRRLVTPCTGGPAGDAGGRALGAACGLTVAARRRRRRVRP